MIKVSFCIAWINGARWYAKNGNRRDTEYICEKSPNLYTVHVFVRRDKTNDSFPHKCVQQ